MAPGVEQLLIDDPNVVVEPGFVDPQVNGGFGWDFTTEPHRIWDVAARLPEHGVTAFLPTLVSASVEEARAADAVLAAGPPAGWIGARPIGLHLEGPAIAPDSRGAHAAARLAEPTPGLVGEWLALASLRMVTIAPELPGATAATERLTEADVVVSIGHTGADRAQVRAVVDAGATAVTHLFNAMAPFHHRDPGVIGAVLDDDRLAVGLIADGVHVAPDALALAWRAAGPDRIVLTTDAVAALGTGSETQARTTEGGLAGGVTPFHEVRQVFRAATGAGDAAGPTTSANARRLLGLGPDPDGDRVVLDQAGIPQRTVIDGQLAHDAHQPPRTR